MIEFINPSKIKHIKSALFVGEGKMLELYEGIASGEFESESAAKRYFYPSMENRNSYFNRLKRSLQDKLANVILLIDHTSSPYDSPQDGFVFCSKNIAVTNIWYFLNPSKKAVVRIAERTMRVAEYHGFADMIFLISRYCYIFYNREGNYKKADHFEKILSKVDTFYD